jgi:hypothetical protein
MENMRRNSRVSEFAEADIRVERQGHEKTQLGIKEYETRLSDVAVIYM